MSASSQVLGFQEINKSLSVFTGAWIKKVKVTPAFDQGQITGYLRSLVYKGVVPYLIADIGNNVAGLNAAAITAIMDDNTSQSLYNQYLGAGNKTVSRQCSNPYNPNFVLSAQSLTTLGVNLTNPIVLAAQGGIIFDIDAGDAALDPIQCAFRVEYTVGYRDDNPVYANVPDPGAFSTGSSAIQNRPRLTKLDRLRAQNPKYFERLDAERIELQRQSVPADASTVIV